MVALTVRPDRLCDRFASRGQVLPVTCVMCLMCDMFDVSQICGVCADSYAHTIPGLLTLAVPASRRAVLGS